MQPWRKIWQWLDDRTGLAGLVRPLLVHPVPPGSKWWYVFGSATLFAFILQIATGIALATVYAPTAGQAFDSLKYITELAPCGRLVRGLHYFGASAMVLLVGIHMLRVFLMASFKFPREMNWVTGVMLLGLTLLMGFTGQLLRWDQNAVWSVVVGAAQAARLPLIGHELARALLSGDTVSSATLSHLFVLHVFIGPLLLVAVLGLHLHLVMFHGISEPPVAGRPVDPPTYRAWYHSMLERTGVPFWPNAAWRDVHFGSLAITAVIVLAWYFGPPALDKPADPTLVEAHPAPDWYLLWYFAVLALLPPRAEDAVMILAPLLGGLALLSVPFISNHGERSWRRRPGAVVLVIFIATCIGVLWRAGVREEWTPNFDAQPLPAKIIGMTSGPVHDGGLVYNSKGCLYCHIISGYGGTRGPELTDVGDRLDRDQLVIRILKGGANMPAYANNITPEQFETLISFLQSRKAP
jgi:ubiquinol-cytochrome c reductase cytochrome b subunit